MADTVRLKIKGVPELLKKLEAVNADVEQAVAASMMASALTVAGDAKRRAPVKTGNLSRSITATGKQDGVITEVQGTIPAQSVESIKKDLKSDGLADAFVATNVVYAAAQEFLPYEHAHGESPYLRPALDENRDTIERTFKTGLEQVIKKAGG